VVPVILKTFLCPASHEKVFAIMTSGPFWRAQPTLCEAVGRERWIGGESSGPRLEVRRGGRAE
jgi:hypothetical protein